jgi:hypothetical protein
MNASSIEHCSSGSRAAGASNALAAPALAVLWLVFVDEPISIYSHAHWSDQERLQAGAIASSPRAIPAPRHVST